LSPPPQDATRRRFQPFVPSLVTIRPDPSCPRFLDVLPRCLSGSAPQSGKRVPCGTFSYDAPDPPLPALITPSNISMYFSVGCTLSGYRWGEGVFFFFSLIQGSGPPLEFPVGQACLCPGPFFHTVPCLHLVFFCLFFFSHLLNYQFISLHLLSGRPEKLLALDGPPPTPP